MKIISVLVWSLVPVLALAGQMPQKDVPSKGAWDFAPVKIWEVETAGGEAFGRIAELLESEDGHVCVRDFGRNISNLFDADGRFIRAFAPQGKGDDQLPFYLNRFRAGGKLVLAAPEKLYFFSSTGEFDHSTPNNLMLRFPLRFTSEHEFIYAPAQPGSTVPDLKLVAVDLGSGRERTLVDLSGAGAVAGEAPQGRMPMLMIFGLTPQMCLAQEGDTLIFGRSDRYEIRLADALGKIRSSFALDRKKGTASLEDRRKAIADTALPDDMKEKIAAQLPGELTHFSHIEAIGGLIYVFAVGDLNRTTGSQSIDIFSGRGDYLYRGRIAFGDGRQFHSPSNLLIANGHAYVILEDGKGGRALAKYRISMPPKSAGR